MQNDSVLTITGAARLLGVCEATARTWSKSGRLPCERAGRIRVFKVADVLRLRDERLAAGK